MASVYSNSIINPAASDATNSGSENLRDRNTDSPLRLWCWLFWFPSAFATGGLNDELGGKMRESEDPELTKIAVDRCDNSVNILTKAMDGRSQAMLGI